MHKRLITLITATASLLALSTSAFAQLPTPSNGWNMGNTLEPNCGVGCWGPKPTQALINSVAAAGFNTVRIPCAWMYQSDSKGKINAAYMSQVKQVVDWCISKKLYVIINDHWDTGWFENSNFDKYDKTISGKLQNMWKQIGTTFKDYDNHLLFACANEPNAHTAAQTKNLFKYYQNFVNTIRATGGNNTSRWLVLQGPSTSIDNTYKFVTDMPTDPTPGRLMIEVHYYDPFQFTGMNPDAGWGKMFYFWGKDYHSTTLPSRNAKWGEETSLATEFDKMKSKFVDKGIPVLIGEWRASPKPVEPDLTGDLIKLNYTSCTYWNKSIHDALNARGMYGTCWDTPGSIFDWTTGAVKDQTQIDALLGKSCIAPISGL